jgi:hypothetical protein
MDKRKTNGGHSTKAKGFDKRKNEYKDVLNDAITTDELKDVIKMLLKKSVQEDDVTAAKILLEYYIGKPQQRIDVTTDDESLNIPIVNFVKSKS